MGIYDRQYYREDEPGGLLGGRSMVINLVLFTVAWYVAQLLFPQIKDWLALSADFPTHPWRVWQLVTYGFMHDPENILHVGFNMFVLWFFGREVEGIYGSREFLRVYLTLIVMSGLTWLIAEMASSQHLAMQPPMLLGASGGVIGVTILYVLHYPRRQILIWGVFPVPAWVIGCVCIAGDVLGTIRDSGDQVAHVAHLAGALFAFIYFRSGWNLGRMVPDRWLELLRRPKLKLHDPDAEVPNLSKQVDQILEKISRQGEGSLTKKERSILEEASRRYQRRRG